MFHTSGSRWPQASNQIKEKKLLAMVSISAVVGFRISKISSPKCRLD
ncbi:hypothetical protein D1AOALGA4SA_4333 [Olavius algarvensis Delta 1 endosymbiont]|nr:hypothetical protein D1AOALGA4SA_4333 [Olavius algarvensis Delta 1 endosymbiont]